VDRGGGGWRRRLRRRPCNKQTTRWTLKITRLGLVGRVVCQQSRGWCASSVRWCFCSGYLKLSTTLKEGRRTLPVALDINRIKPAIPASAKPPRLCCFCTLVRVGVSVVWLQTYLTKERYKRHLGHLGHHETTFLSLVSHPSGFSVLHTFVSSMES